jgi:hypothetical protein
MRPASSGAPLSGHRFTEITTLPPATGRQPASGLSPERRELLCSAIGLTVKLSLALLAGVSLVRLAGAYQERMDRQGELAAVLDLEQAKLARARERFDRLFGADGEQQLIREQNQWIAPNRLRVVWNDQTARPAEAVAAQP